MAKPNLNPLMLVPKSDLKAARLVCKAWRVLASELLFETVYVSANQEDLDVFLGIAGSEELSVGSCFSVFSMMRAVDCFFCGYDAQRWLQWPNTPVVEP